MKKIVFFILISCKVPVFAQVYINGVDINKEPEVRLCIIEDAGVPLLSKKSQMTLDYGQAQSQLAQKRITDENAKPIVFESVVAALNHMEKNGWQFVQVVPEFFQEKLRGNRYLFRKRDQ